MNVDQKLAAIRDLIQQDVGNRGLARDPNDNLLTATRDDFANACASIAETSEPRLVLLTGFKIPTTEPPTYETDGPLGTVFLLRAMAYLGIPAAVWGESDLNDILCGAFATSNQQKVVRHDLPSHPKSAITNHFRRYYRKKAYQCLPNLSHVIAIERVGPNYTMESLRTRFTTTDMDMAAFAASVPAGQQGRCHSMRGHDVTEMMSPVELLFEPDESARFSVRTIGIGDGGNEIGMGRLPWSTIRRNIPNGAQVACRVAADYLIVCGISNWGAYALAIGISLLRGVSLPEELLNPERERQMIELMVRRGPLVDGVTGKRTATVDGLSWDDYIRPLVEIGKIVRS